MAKKKKKRKIPLRTLLRRAHKAADRAFSLFIRARDRQVFNGKCLLCKERTIQCAFHIVRRGRKILRWHPANAIGACHRCNYIEYRNPDLSRAWYIRHFGTEQYLYLVDKSEEEFTPALEQLQQIISAFTNALREL